MKRLLQLTTLLLCFSTSAQQLEQDSTTVTLLRLSEQTYYELREQQLFPLNPELLNKGNWSTEDLKELARHYTYQSYLNQLNDLKSEIQKIGIQLVNIENFSSEPTGTFWIVHSFKSEIYRGGGIGLMIHLNLYEQQNALLTDTHWGKVKKELKRWLKTVDNRR